MYETVAEKACHTPTYAPEMRSTNDDAMELNVYGVAQASHTSTIATFAMNIMLHEKILP